MVNPTLEQLAAALRNSWTRETAFDANDWTEENPARGQCVVSALVAQDYFGGDLQRYEAVGDGFTETHYANLLDGGVILDTTASQYDKPVQLTPTPTNLKEFSSIREKRLADKETRSRYETLGRRVAAFLAQ